MALASHAIAQPASPPQGAAALSRARAAWQKGEFDAAETQYAAALDAGGLAPNDVVDAYVHIGCALTVMKKRSAALDAFRHAALLDSKFTVPPEAGKGASYLAEAMRKEKGKFGSISLRAEAPSLVKTGQSFAVDASLDNAHMTLVAKITVSARDALTEKSYEHDAPPAPDVRFDIPAQLTLPGASLTVRVDALDAHKNRLASVERLVRVEGTVPRHDVATHENPTPKEKDGVSKSGGGFWSTAWPYVLGGVALAAGGTAVYFGTRPPDAVSVGSVHVQTAR